MSEKKKTKTTNIALIENIETRIFVVRGKKVMLDKDLADLYEVETKMFNRSVKRNIDRFPNDFMFQLTKDEFENLRFQIGTSRWGGRRYLPYVFTQEGVAMLSGILNSKRAVAVNIQIMRAFVRLREMLSTHADLKKKIDRIEKSVDEKFGQHDQQIKFIFEAITKLLAPPKMKVKKVKKIGYKTDEKL